MQCIAKQYMDTLQKWHWLFDIGLCRALVGSQAFVKGLQPFEVVSAYNISRLQSGLVVSLVARSCLTL